MEYVAAHCVVAAAVVAALTIGLLCAILFTQLLELCLHVFRFIAIKDGPFAHKIGSSPVVIGEERMER